MTKQKIESGEKPLELLVVEDNEKHIADARAYFAPIEQKGIIQVAYATTLAEAQKALDKTNFDGVISDVFFPIGETKETKKLMFELETLMREQIKPPDEYSKQFYIPHNLAIDSWVNGKTTPPSGVILTRIANGKGIHTVLNTDTYHHGDATQPVSTWATKENIQLVETGKGDKPGESKDWRGAYWIVAANIETHSHHKEIVAYALDGNSLGLYFEKKDSNVPDTNEERAEIRQLRQRIFEKYCIDRSGLSY